MSQSSPRPSSKTRRAAAAADEAARAARDEAAVPDAAEEQLRVIGQANALVSELADARRRVADSKTLKQSHVDALVNATLEYVKVPDGDAVSKRIRQDEAVEKIIAALSQLYITVFQVFGSTSSSKQAERTLWLTERVKSTLTISHAPIFNSMNVTGVSSDRRSRMNSALDSLNKLAVERMMFTFDNEDKTLLSISDRPWASELRYLLSASGLLNHVEEVTPGATLGLVRAGQQGVADRGARQLHRSGCRGRFDAVGDLFIQQDRYGRC
jgi:phosphohistidine phosphatase SixA